MDMPSQIDQMLDSIFSELVCSEKKKLVCLATTANINNPPLYVGAIRHTPTTIAANFLFGDLDMLETVIRKFDGTADYFLIDCEVKNATENLMPEAIRLINKSPWHIFKPNDITVETLDAWLSILVPDCRDKKVVVCGVGNIGAKSALRLAERGARVILWGRDDVRLKCIADGLAMIKRGAGFFEVSLDVHQCSIGAVRSIPCSGSVQPPTRPD